MTQLQKFHSEFARALRNGNVELSPQGVLFRAARIFVGGTMSYSIDNGPRVLGDNTATTEGLIDILSVYFASGAQRTGFYFVPYANNVAPDANVTAANFNATLGEFTNYTATQRLQWVPGAITTPSADNSATTAQLVIGTGGGTIRGAGLATASAKSATTGVVPVVAAFADPAVMNAGGKLNLEYVITAQDV